jgi:hypothetical protein
MKDQYFGDVNDFRKYSLLLSLSGGGALRTGVCWMLTPPDGRSDGSALFYLLQPERYRHLAPDLFDLMHRAVLVEQDRRVARFECASLLPNAVFHSQLLGDARDARTAYFATAARLFRDAEWVFFDPDNGLEVTSVAIGRKNSSKFLYWQEVEATFHGGKSVLVYQHFPRTPRDNYIRGLCSAMFARIGAARVLSFRTPHVVFLLVPQARHAGHFLEQAARITSAWPPSQIAVAEHLPDLSLTGNPCPALRHRAVGR